MTDSELIKRARTVLGLKQQQFADRLKVNSVSVSRWESDARSPDPEVFRSVLELIVADLSSQVDRQQHVLAVASELAAKKSRNTKSR